MKVLSLFSGIGAFEKALVNLGVPCDLVAFCEIDKYAARSYAAIHGVSESMNIGDITKVNEKNLPKDIDLVTYGFPCQDISLCGDQKGLFNADGTQTRSGLFFDALRIIEETQPKVAIAENVKNLASKKFALQFKIILDSLRAAGYNNYWQILNAKKYGIPQNRERVFIVSIRKDIDNGKFEFPKPCELNLRLQDLLEDEVDEKYFLSEKGVQYVTEPSRLSKSYTQIDGDVALCVTAMSGLNWTGTFVSVPINTAPDGTCRAIKAQYYKTGPANLFRTSTFGATGVLDGKRLRKFTPKECFRLMGFYDSDFEKAEAVNSNTQLYKQAGNSIVVPVVQNIVRSLFDCGALKEVSE